MSKVDVPHSDSVSLLEESILRKILLILCTPIVSWMYILPSYRHWSTGDWETGTKPFVYRQFSIQIVDLLKILGLSYSNAAFIFTLLGCITFLFALIYLLDGQELFAMIGLTVFTIIFQPYLKLYDLPTAIFFTLALVFLAHGHIKAYLLVFALSSINRETTILLLFIFLIYFWLHEKKFYWKYGLVQIGIFGIIQGIIRYAFRDASGQSIWISPIQNIQTHLNRPVPSFISLMIIMIILWFVFQNWYSKPILLRVSFVVLFPALVILYFVCGQAFEFRVFAEIFPVLMGLINPNHLLRN